MLIQLRDDTIFSAPTTGIDPAHWQGTYFIGTLLDFFCLAVLFGLFLQYNSVYGTSDRRLKWVVYLLVIFACLKSAQVFYIAWMLNIEYFGRVAESFAWSHNDWAARSNPLMVALFCAYAQSFYIYRLWAISRRWLFVSMNIFLLVLSVAAASILTGYNSGNMEHTENLQMWMQIHFTSVFASDIFMTVTLSYHLFQAKKDVSPYTVGVLEALLRVTFFTGLPATVCALINLILSCHTDFNVVLHVIMVNQPLPFLFAISMLWTINARTRIKQCGERDRDEEERKAHEVSSELVFVAMKGTPTESVFDSESQEPSKAKDP